MIEDTYEGNVKKIYAFFYYKTFNQNLAEDLTSQTFLIFLEKYYQADAEINHPDKFLYGIMRKVWLRYLQEKYKSNELFVEDIEDFAIYVNSEVEQEDQTPDHERIMQFISLLPSKQQTIMRMRLVEKLTLKEICAELNKNMNYVKTTQQRGVQNLKKLLSNSEHGLGSEGAVV